MAKPSYLVKLERAREHLQTFEEEAGTWIETKPYGIVDEPDPEPPAEAIHRGCQNHRFRVDRAGEIPSRLSAIIGDCVFNLRASLDHLVMALSVKHTGSLNERQLISTEFPIYSTEAKFLKDKKGPNKIALINPAAKAIIHACQPYRAGKDLWRHPLWRIQELNNVDKHRALTVCAGASMRNGNFHAESIEIGKEARNFDYIPYIKPIPTELVLDAIIFRWAAMPIDPDREIRLEPNLPVEIVLGKDTIVPYGPVIPTLQHLCDVVGGEIIPSLSQFL